MDALLLAAPNPGGGALASCRAGGSRGALDITNIELVIMSIGNVNHQQRHAMTRMFGIANRNLRCEERANKHLTRCSRGRAKARPVD